MPSPGGEEVPSFGSVAELLIVDLPFPAASIALSSFWINMQAALRSIQTLRPEQMSLILADVCTEQLVALSQPTWTAILGKNEIDWFKYFPVCFWHEYVSIYEPRTPRL